MFRKYSLVCLAALVLCGCAQTARSRRVSGSSMRFGDADAVKAFDAAAKALRGSYRLAEVDNTDMVLKTVPFIYNARNDREKPSTQVLGGKKTYRRVVQVRAEPTEDGKGSVVTVRVGVERFDSPAARAFAYQRESSDLPADRAMRDATPVKREHREVWTFVSRDRTEEQRILAAIAALLGK